MLQKSAFQITYGTNIIRAIGTFKDMHPSHENSQYHLVVEQQVYVASASRPRRYRDHILEIQFLFVILAGSRYALIKATDYSPTYLSRILSINSAVLFPELASVNVTSSSTNFRRSFESIVLSFRYRFNASRSSFSSLATRPAFAKRNR